jgi:uncharacterized membrane protein YedE/YeeE
VSAPGRSRAVALGIAVLAGVLFGAGLVISGMTQPERIVRFLDPLDGWDPSLALVMAGAVAVHGVAYAAIRRRARPWFDGAFHVPARSVIDARLVAGAAVFGIGWGLGGFCPGPGIVAAAGGSVSALVFVVAMLAGLRLGRGRDG